MTQKDIDMARLQADIEKNKLSLDADKETDKRRVLADLIKARNGR